MSTLTTLDPEVVWDEVHNEGVPVSALARRWSVHPDAIRDALVAGKAIEDARALKEAKAYKGSSVIPLGLYNPQSKTQVPSWMVATIRKMLAAGEVPSTIAAMLGERKERIDGIIRRSMPEFRHVAHESISVANSNKRRPKVKPVPPSFWGRPKRVAVDEAEVAAQIEVYLRDVGVTHCPARLSVA